MSSFIRNLKLSHRLAVLVGVFVIGFSGYCAWSFKTLNELKVNGPVYQRIVQGKDLIADILPPPEYIIESYLVSLQLATAEAKEEQDGLAARLKALKAEYDTRHEFWLKEELDEGLKRQFLVEAHDPAMAFYKTAFDEFIPAVQKQDKEAAAAAMARMKQAYETHRKAIDQVVQATTKRNEADEVFAAQRIESSAWTMLAIFAVSLGAAIALAVLIVRRLLASLGGEPEYAAEISHRIAAGDLTMDIVLKDSDSNSLLYSMKTMQAMLAQAVSDIQVAAESVSTGSEQIAIGNRDLASRTEEQASALGETASAMEEQSATVKQSADNSLQANTLAHAAAEAAVKGGAVMSEVVQTMGRINESSRQIADIIGVIEGIAFQTNILALNAAVEAARAGEQGRGFAVVASEVRNLAQRSATAAKEIRALISSSVEQVGVGARLVDQAGATMEEIVAGVKRVNDIIGEITAASREQIGGFEQINQAVVEMDRTTQENAALVEETAAAAASLQEQTGSLVNVVRVFKLRGAQVASFVGGGAGRHGGGGSASQARLPLPNARRGVKQIAA
jgi:methyl-accepting chemotaxis protein